MHKTNNVVQYIAAFEFIGVSEDAYLGLGACLGVAPSLSTTLCF